MGRPRQLEGKLSRAHATHDIALRFIRNLETLAQEARINIEKQPTFNAQYVLLDKYEDFIYLFL